MVAAGNAARTACLALGLAAGIEARAGRIGADRRDLHQPRTPAAAAAARDRAGAVRLDALEVAGRRSARMPTRLTTRSAPSTARATVAGVGERDIERHHLADRAHGFRNSAASVSRTADADDIARAASRLTT